MLFFVVLIWIPGDGSDFWVEFKKDIYHVEYLLSLGLNNRQVKDVLFA